MRDPLSPTLSLHLRGVWEKVIEREISLTQGADMMYGRLVSSSIENQLNEDLWGESGIYHISIFRMSYIGQSIQHHIIVKYNLERRKASYQIRAFYSVLPTLKSKEVYRTIIRPVLVFDHETWTIPNASKNAVHIFERGILRIPSIILAQIRQRSD